MKINFFLLCAFLFALTAMNCKANNEQTLTVKSGDTLIVSDLQEMQNVHIESGGSLIIKGGGILKILPDGNLKIDSEATLIIDDCDSKLLVYKEASITNSGRIRNRGTLAVDYEDDNECQD